MPKTTPIQKLGVIGAGAWGTALAGVARRAGRAVILWAHEADIAATIDATGENPVFLPGVALDPGIRATADLTRASDADALLLATPAQHLRAVTAALAPHLPADRPPPVIVCAKGIELETGRLMGEVLAETLPGSPVAILSGPTFAAEVARDLPTAVTLAAADEGLGRRLVAAIGTPHFRPYLSDDPVGVQIGGAVKNVIAIACGIVTGRRLGDNARAALITRGLAEMVRLGLAKDARETTLMGLSGLGDLTLTCNGPQSRNLSLGIALGEGRTLAELLEGRRSVAEGVATAASVAALARRLKIEMPIAAAVDAILHRGAAVDETIAALLARPFRSETVGSGSPEAR